MASYRDATIDFMLGQIRKNPHLTEITATIVTRDPAAEGSPIRIASKSAALRITSKLDGKSVVFDIDGKTASADEGWFAAGATHDAWWKRVKATMDRWADDDSQLSAAGFNFLED